MSTVISDIRPDREEIYENERLTALVKVMIDTKWTFKSIELAIWRPTERASGQITGVIGNVTIVATDNNRGLFLQESGEPFIGHIQHFTGKVKSLIKKPRKYDVPSPDGDASPPVNKPKVRKTKAQRAVEAWKKFMSE